MDQCRTCRSFETSYRTFSSVFDEGVHEILTGVLQIQVPENNVCSNICSLCRDLLFTFERFRLTCQESAEYFLNLEISKEFNGDPSRATANALNEDDEAQLENQGQFLEVDGLGFNQPENGTESTPENDHENLDPGLNTDYTHREGNLTCGYCQHSTNGKADLIHHMQTVHSLLNKDYKCSECGLILNSRMAYYRHKSSHTRKICSVCGVNLRASSFKSHLRTHDENRELFECKPCNISFKTKESFRLHELSHDGEIFSCDICDKQLQGPAHIRIHKRAMHNGTHECKNCPMEFLTEKRLKAHERQTHDELESNRPSDDFQFTCDECGLRFKAQNYLTDHRKLHDRQREELKLVCIECGKRCRSEAHLAAHRASHSGRILSQDVMEIEEVDENFEDMIEEVIEEESSIVKVTAPKPVEMTVKRIFERPKFKRPTLIIKES